jgi:TatD DNase family protein
MAPLFDTHSHLQDERFDDDLDAVVARAAAAGVRAMVVCGYDEPSNARAIELSRRYEPLYAAVGFQPHESGAVTAAMLERLADAAGGPDVVAVGEIGLDHHWDGASPADQLRVLNAQLEIAAAIAKPVCIHSRDAEDAVYEPLAAYASRSPLPATGRPPGVMHCFGGTLEQALRFVELGFLLSIACPITYPRNTEAQRIAAGLPLESLVVETDSPYLPPQGRRGQRNEPAYVREAAEAIASARGVSLEHVAEVTTANACRMFGVRVREMVGVRC